MGKGKKNQYDQLAVELEAYMSASDDEDSKDEVIPLAELEKQEMSKALLLENLPVTTSDKVEKLHSRIEEMLKQCDEYNSGFRFQMPTGEDGSTLGFGFVCFETEEAARTCQKLVNGFKLGKYEIKVYPYTALDTYANLSDEFQAPPEPTYSEGIALEDWLFDGREQFVVRQADETLVFWADALAMGGEPELCYGGERDKAKGKVWCRKQVMWSPNGRYLATFHNQGLVLWGGKDFQRAGSFAHPMVTHAEFSPCERFLITYAEDLNDDDESREALIVWNIQTQTAVKAFSDPRRDARPGATEWPYMRWSPDGAYFARCIENGISVFSTSTMKLVDGKPVAVRGIASFEWSPSDNYVAYWCPEDGDVPARVAIFDPINKKEIRSKNLVNVSAVKLFWQNKGDFLCAQVTRHTKTKKTTFTNFEVFRVRDSGCPNETLSMTETISCFAFEPNGYRFAIVHSEQPDGGIKGKMPVSLYTLGAIKNGAKLELLQTLDSRACQEVFWSPTGGILLLGSLDYSAHASVLPPGSTPPFAGSGAFEFYDVDQKQSLAHFDHYMCNDVKWDPSGRFVATIVNQPMFGEVAMRYTVENGYRLYSFQGQKLRDVPFSDMYQVSAF